MNNTIDSLTLGDLKQIKKLLSAERATEAPHPFIGRFVLCRCESAGVHVGILKSANEKSVILADSRRLWYWKAKKGIALSGVAQHGVTTESKIDTCNPEIALNGVVEIIPCSVEAMGTFCV